MTCTVPTMETYIQPLRGHQGQQHSLDCFGNLCNCPYYLLERGFLCLILGILSICFLGVRSISKYSGDESFSMKL